MIRDVDIQIDPQSALIQDKLKNVLSNPPAAHDLLDRYKVHYNNLRLVARSAPGQRSNEIIDVYLAIGGIEVVLFMLGFISDTGRYDINVRLGAADICTYISDHDLDGATLNPVLTDEGLISSNFSDEQAGYIKVLNYMAGV